MHTIAIGHDRISLEPKSVIGQRYSAVERFETLQLVGAPCEGDTTSAVGQSLPR